MKFVTLLYTVYPELAYLAEYLGPHKILWATDYPHPDGFFLGAPAMIADKLSEEHKR